MPVLDIGCCQVFLCSALLLSSFWYVHLNAFGNMPFAVQCYHIQGSGNGLWHCWQIAFQCGKVYMARLKYFERQLFSLASNAT